MQLVQMLCAVCLPLVHIPDHSLILRRTTVKCLVSRKEKTQLLALRTLPVAAWNIRDSLLLKMTFVMFQGTVATFHRCVDKSIVTDVEYAWDFVHYIL